MKDKKAQLEQIARYDHFIQSRAGRAVRPYRADGYVNFLNKYGTSRDSSETYQFVSEPEISDMELTDFYESNGLFAKVIDAPAEEAVKNGFELLEITDEKTIDFYKEALDELDWEELFTQGIKWQRLFGGAIAVMFINDGHGLDDPLDWKHIKSIDDIVLFDRSLVEPDYDSIFHYDPHDPFSTRGSRLGSPEYYRIFSKYGNAVVHESRCLEFKNGTLPENTLHTQYQLWGLPEYLRINRALRDAEISHGSASKLLDRSIQAVYKMKDLSTLLSTQEGEDMVLRRMQVIDMARGLLSSMVIDAEGEDYGFQTFSFAGVADVIDTTCNFVSALTNIPQTILFGKAPQGLSTNDESGLETWYSYVRRLQKRSMRSNLRYLLSVIFQAGLRTGEIDEVPKIKIEFNPLKVVSETEQLDIEQKKAQVQLTKAQTAQAYIDMQVIDTTEVRKGLARSEDFDIETILDDYDEEDLFENDPANQQEQPDDDAQTEPEDAEGSSAPNAPAATKLPQDMTEQNLEQAERANKDESPKDAKLAGVGVICEKDGKILCGTRFNDSGYGLLCGPGGHIEEGETSEQAAIRESQEEFGITPKSLISLGFGPIEPETNTYPEVFLCTEWQGEPICDEDEMIHPQFLSLEELAEYDHQMFHPFKAGLKLMLDKLTGKTRSDGGDGSGNWGHEGREGKIGGSKSGGGVHNRMKDAEGGYTSFSKNKKKFATPHKTDDWELECASNGAKVIYSSQKYGKTSWTKQEDAYVNDDTGEVLNSYELYLECQDNDVRVIVPDSDNHNFRKRKGSTNNVVSISAERIKSAASPNEPQDADDLYRTRSGEVWQKLSSGQKEALYNYTGSGYRRVNRALRSAEDSPEAGVAESINNLTTAIAQCKLDKDVWLRRGTGKGSLENLFGLPKGSLTADNIGVLVGQNAMDKGFMSCGSAPGTGFTKKVSLKILAPAGTEAMYAEPFSKLGHGYGLDWDGKKKQSSFSNELETILQRGTRMQCISAEYLADGTIEVALVITEQKYDN